MLHGVEKPDTRIQAIAIANSFQKLKNDSSIVFSAGRIRPLRATSHRLFRAAISNQKNPAKKVFELTLTSNNDYETTREKAKKNGSDLVKIISVKRVRAGILTIVIPQYHR